MPPHELLAPSVLRQGVVSSLAGSVRPALADRLRTRLLRHPPIPIADQFELYTHLHGLRNRLLSDAPTDPWSFVHVDPAEVERFTTGLELPWGLGRVQTGDWDRDRHCQAIRDNTKFRGLHQRFEEGRDWVATDYYEDVQARFEAGENPRGYPDFETFENERLADVDALARSIEDDGWQPNVETDHDPEDWTEYASSLDPLVAIGRDGEVLWYEGYTRFMLADILGVDEIPVLVLCRHEQWQARREQVAAGDSAGSDHPDLRAVPTGQA
ncbi:hypothetical protein [Haloarchaeobius amylolyticus]|uniref:hypothetical protein n=1 Tax=Haloarchaeobius amylolyticus TaxID=1198296 RepID=UPI002270A08E|nr:hypothetical protein [Haloarchaeobius amylolyticus]